MLNSVETREIVTLKSLEILIMVDKGYNEDKDLNPEFKEFYAELKTFANSFSKEVNKGRFKKKIDKCIIKIKMDLFDLKEYSIAMTFGMLNETLKKNVPLFYSFYKIT